MDELLGRKIPHSASAEQAVIGSMLIDPRCIPEVMEKLSADEFYIKLNHDIYETVYSMFAYGQTIDPVTVLDQMKVSGQCPGVRGHRQGQGAAAPSGGDCR